MAAIDPLAEMLERIRTGVRERKDSVLSPASKLRVRVLDVLAREGYIRGYSQEESGPAKGIRIDLKYFEGQPSIKHIVRVAKPGRRIHGEPPDKYGLGVNLIGRSAIVYGGGTAQEQHAGAGLHVVQSTKPKARAEGSVRGVKVRGALDWDVDVAVNIGVDSELIDTNELAPSGRRPGMFGRLAAAKAAPRKLKAVTDLPPPPELDIDNIILDRALVIVSEADVEAVLTGLARAQGGLNARPDIKLAKALGFADLPSLRASLRERLEREAAQLSATDLKRQLFDQLAARHDFAVPEAMVEAEFSQLWAHREREHGRRSHEEETALEEAERAEYRDIAERRMRLGIVLALVGREAGIEVSEAEAKAALTTVDDDAKPEAKAWRERLRKDPSAIDQLRGPLFEEKVVAYLLAHTALNDRAMSYDELERLIEGDVDQIDDVPLGEAGDAVRLKLLDDAASGTPSDDPREQVEARVFSDAVALLGGADSMGVTVSTLDEMLAAILQGLPAGVLNALNQAGWSHDQMERVIAPRRTLMRRKADGGRLKRDESDAAWRLAHTLTLASHVLSGRAAAFEWLNRPKQSMFGLAPLDLLSTSLGTDQVQRTLRALDWGDIA